MKKCIDCGNLVSTKKTIRCRSCEDIKRKTIFSEINHPQSNGYYKKCICCERNFYVARGNDTPHKRFCSRKCKSDYSRIVKICEYCGQEFSTHLKYQNDFCSKECVNHSLYGKSAWNKGKVCWQLANDNNSQWRGGLSRLPYSKDWSRSLKETIRQRDNHKCQLCGVPQLECIDRLNVHHIDYNKKNCAPSNLISLCRRCHCKTTTNREYWITLFIKQMEVKNVVAVATFWG